MTPKCLPAKISTHIFDHVVWRKEWDNAINIKGLKNGFVENIGQLGPLLVVSKTLWQMSVVS